MLDEDCKHGLAGGTCILCKPKPPEPPEPTGMRRGPTAFYKRAFFEGVCPECFERIEIGDEIAVNLEDKWAHRECV